MALAACRRFRILFVSHSSALAGAEAALLSHLRFLDRERWDPIVVLPGDGILRPRLEELGVRIISLPLEWWIPGSEWHGAPHFGRLLRGLEANVAALVGIIEREGIDVVQTNSVVVIDGALAAALTGRPHIWHVHENLLASETLKPYMPVAATFSWAERLADRVVVVSEYLSRRLRPHIGAEKLRVIIGGVPVADFSRPLAPGRLPLRAVLGCGDSSPLVGAVGSVTARKNPGGFVAVAARVLLARPDARFVWIGDHTDRRAVAAAMETARRLGVGDCVRFVGFQSSVPEALAALDVVIHPSFNENLSLACIEAMAAGKPVVASRCGGPEEVVVEGETGFLVPDGDMKAMASRVLALLSDDGLRARFGACGRQRALERFDAARAAGEFETLYEEVIGGGLEADRSRTAERIISLLQILHRAGGIGLAPDSMDGRELLLLAWRHARRKLGRCRLWRREGAYDRWLRGYGRSSAPLPVSLACRPLLSIITPVFNTDPMWLRPFFASIRAQTYSHWELCIADDASDDPRTREALAGLAADPRVRITRLANRSGIAAASNAALAMAGGDYVALMDSDDEIPPDALLEVVRSLNEHPGSDSLYSDEDKLDGQGRRCDPYFKPDWSPELLYSCMYINHLMVLRRSLVIELGGFRDACTGSQDYDLALRVAARTDRIRHIPKILYHWRKTPGSAAETLGGKPGAEQAGRRALADRFQSAAAGAEVLPGPLPGLYRVRRPIRGSPLVTVILPCGAWTSQAAVAGESVLARSIRSAAAKTGYDNVEWLAAGAGEMPAAVRDSMDSLARGRFAYVSCGSAGLLHQLNHGARRASGEHLLFLDPGLEAMVPEWLEAMLEYSQQPDIGAVGAKLFSADGRIEHIGICLGVNGGVAYPFRGNSAATPGYGASAIVVRNCSAISGACLMTPRALFLESGGFDERYRAAGGDVDYCLRLGRVQRRIVFTPYARLRRIRARQTDWWAPRNADLARLRATWGDRLESDPYYNPNLSRRHADGRLRE